jgi:sporulation protein YlmC with PRC-barrel domain
MELIRDILDKQLLDERGVKMGKVDGLLMVLQEGKQPRVTHIQLGSVVLARRLGRLCGGIVSELAAYLGGEERREPIRIGWDKVRDIGVDIDLAVDSRDPPLADASNWLNRKIVFRLGG